MFNCSYVKFLSLYKAFTLSVQDKCAYCTKVYKGTYVKGFHILLKNWLAHFPFLNMGDIPHSSSYTFIGWATVVMMNRYLNWVSFSPFLLSHDIGMWLPHPYALIFNCSYVDFLPLYKAFTLSVLGKCTNYTKVYKGVYLKGFEMILKNLFAFSNHGGHSSHTLLDHTPITCILFDVCHVHSFY